MSDCPAPPDAASLREAAMAHLARFATTEAGLRQVLERRIRRWATRATRAGLPAEEAEATCAALRPAIDDAVKRMAGLGAVDDAGFARSRALNLTRTGRSRRAVAAHLMTHGVDRDTTHTALDESLGERNDDAARDAELAAALVLARKRRLGPFRRPDHVPGPEHEDLEHADAESHPDQATMKALAIFARNGFSLDVARMALEMDTEEAEDRIIAFRSR